MSDRIDVSGTGTAQSRPDRLVARLGAEGIGADVAAALTAGQIAARAMAGAARTAGVVDSDLRTEDMSVGQHHDQQGQPSGYRAWLGLTVTVRDVDVAGAVLGEVLAAGGDAARLLGVSLAVSDPSTALEAGPRGGGGRCPCAGRAPRGAGRSGAGRRTPHLHRRRAGDAAPDRHGGHGRSRRGDAGGGR